MPACPHEWLSDAVWWIVARIFAESRTHDYHRGALLDRGRVGPPVQTYSAAVGCGDGLTLVDWSREPAPNVHHQHVHRLQKWMPQEETLSVLMQRRTPLQCGADSTSTSQRQMAQRVGCERPLTDLLQ